VEDLLREHSTTLASIAASSPIGGSHVGYSASPYNPLLKRSSFMVLYHRLSRTRISVEPESALCLVVWALGAAATEQMNLTKSDPAHWTPGAEYLSPVIRILLSCYLDSLGTTIALPQALFLASKYFGYLLRPLQSWRFVHMASTNVQHLYTQ
jgi:hypothetical protein